MKEKIREYREKIKALEARQTQVDELSSKSEDAKELRSLHTEAMGNKALLEEYRALVAALESRKKEDDNEPDDDDESKGETTGPYCAKCGSLASGGAKFCAKCGSVMRDNRPAVAHNTNRQFNVLGTFGDPAQAQAQQKPEQRSLESVIAIPDVQEMRTELFKHPIYRQAFLKRLQNKKLDEIEQRAITTADATGGAAVAQTTYDLIIQKLRMRTALFPLIRATYIPGNVKLPVANALNASAWTAQAVANASGDDSVSAVNLTGYTLSKFAAISIQAQQMSIDAFESYIVDQISLQQAIAIETAIVNGAGPSGSPACPLGIIPGVTWDAANSLTYAKAGLQYSDVVNARKLLRSVYRPFAYWVMNSGMEAQIMNIKSTTGFPIFSQAPQDGFALKILNLPYVLNDYMPDDNLGLYCPLWYYMNFSQPPRIEASTEAGFTTSTILYRGMLVADGAPALSEAFVNMTKAAA